MLILLLTQPIILGIISSMAVTPDNALERKLADPQFCAALANKVSEWRLAILRSDGLEVYQKTAEMSAVMVFGHRRAKSIDLKSPITLVDRDTNLLNDLSEASLALVDRDFDDATKRLTALMSGKGDLENDRYDRHNQEVVMGCIFFAHSLRGMLSDDEMCQVFTGNNARLQQMRAIGKFIDGAVRGDRRKIARSFKDFGKLLEPWGKREDYMERMEKQYALDEKPTQPEQTAIQPQFIPPTLD